MPYLMLLNEKGLPVKEWKLGAAPLSVGRSTSMDISVEDPRMSRQHFRIEQIEDAVWVTDLDSKTGIKVNGQIRGSTVLKPGDMIEAGDSSFFYESGLETIARETETPSHHTTIGKVIRNLRIPDSSTNKLKRKRT